jgi:hypothetical protein
MPPKKKPRTAIGKTEAATQQTPSPPSVPVVTQDICYFLGSDATIATIMSSSSSNSSSNNSDGSSGTGGGGSEDHYAVELTLPLNKHCTLQLAQKPIMLKTTTKRASVQSMEYYVIIKWGANNWEEHRIEGPYITLDSAVDVFEDLFYKKTMNKWRNRKKFVPKKYHYSLRENSSVVDVKFCEEELWQCVVLLYNRMFPFWAPVAEGEDQSQKWLSGRSTDCLTFFSGWILFKAPIEKLKLFLITDNEEMKSELNRNVKLYTESDGFLRSYDPGCHKDAVQSFNSRVSSHSDIIDFFSHALRDNQK